MSCNGCRVLRKGCSDDCILRHCLHPIQSPQAQAHATLFVSRFFGRATLFSFLSAVPASLRPPLFQSLLFEAVGRTINPVNGAVGLLWTGNWRLCQLGVETVLRGGALSPLPPEFTTGATSEDVSFGPAVNSSSCHKHQGRHIGEGPRMLKREVIDYIGSDRSLPERAEKNRAATTASTEGCETTTFGSRNKPLRLFF